MHPCACYMSKVALAAEKQGNYWEMSSLLYENQPKNEEKLLELVKKLNFDEIKFIEDFKAPATLNKIIAEIKKGEELEIDATPTMFINGEQLVGVKPYYKLKEILIKHGAKRK